MPRTDARRGRGGPTSRQAEAFARRNREQRRKAGHSQALIADRMPRILGANVDTRAVSRSDDPDSGRVPKLDEAAAIAEAIGAPPLRTDGRQARHFRGSHRPERQSSRRRAPIEAELYRALLDAQEGVCSISRRLRWLNDPPTK